MLLLNVRRSLFALLGWTMVGNGATVGIAGELSLNSLADNDSSYYEYYSEGFIRMDQFASSNPANQNFHNISDPSVQYGQSFDGFPNDRSFRLGHVTFDESGLVMRTGAAPITGVTLGIARDPVDPTYENWRRFTTTTIIDSFEGVVNLVDGAAVSATLNAAITLRLTNVLGSTLSGDYIGRFSLDGARFDFQAEGEPVLDTAFGTAPFHLRWDFGGRLTALPDYLSDYDEDGVVDGRDFLVWQREFGSAAAPAGSGADGDLSGTIDAGDLAVWQTNFGQYNPMPAPTMRAVPEPTGASIILLGLAACVNLADRRRSRN
jgi:hypothetical protein